MYGGGPTEVSAELLLPMHPGPQYQNTLRTQDIARAIAKFLPIDLQNLITEMDDL